MLFRWFRLLFGLATLAVLPGTVFASDSAVVDTDHDSLTDVQEVKYGTNPAAADTDGDGHSDGEEVAHGYDPLVSGDARLPKRIDIDLSEQRLRYSYGEFGEQGNFLISSGIRGRRTPAGAFAVTRKLPKVTYKGKGYYYPNAKWNLEFLPHYYIHGAYWHHNFGRPMSHGCVNVSYKDMPALYEFADVGTTITIHP